MLRFLILYWTGVALYCEEDHPNYGFSAWLYRATALLVLWSWYYVAKLPYNIQLVHYTKLYYTRHRNLGESVGITSSCPRVSWCVSQPCMGRLKVFVCITLPDLSQRNVEESVCDPTAVCLTYPQKECGESVCITPTDTLCPDVCELIQ